MVFCLRPCELCLRSGLVKPDPNCTGESTRGNELGLGKWGKWGKHHSTKNELGLARVPWKRVWKEYVGSQEKKYFTWRSSPAESSVARWPYIVWQKSSASAQLIGEEVCRKARSDFCKRESSKLQWHHVIAAWAALVVMLVRELFPGWVIKS